MSLDDVSDPRYEEMLIKHAMFKRMPNPTHEEREVILRHNIKFVELYNDRVPELVYWEIYSMMKWNGYPLSTCTEWLLRYRKRITEFQDLDVELRLAELYKSMRHYCSLQKTIKQYEDVLQTVWRTCPYPLPNTLESPRTLDVTPNDYPALILLLRFYATHLASSSLNCVECGDTHIYPKDTAFLYWRQSAALGDVGSMTQLGWNMTTNDWTPATWKEGHAWYEVATQPDAKTGQRNALACYEMGRLYNTSWRCGPNRYDTALRYYAWAHDNGYPLAALRSFMLRFRLPSTSSLERQTLLHNIRLAAKEGGGGGERGEDGGVLWAKLAYAWYQWMTPHATTDERHHALGVMHRAATPIWTTTAMDPTTFEPTTLKEWVRRYLTIKADPLLTALSFPTLPDPL